MKDTNIDIIIKEACEAKYRALAMTPDYSESGKQLKFKVTKEYEQAIKRLDEVVGNMKNIESELHEYICNYCDEKNMSIDLRFQCFGDKNKFYANNIEFSVDCVSYYTKDFNDIKQFFVNYLNHIWEDCKYPINRTALYIKDIVNMDSWYEVIIGGCLFVDDALT